MTAEIPSQIGRYRLLAEIGRGGFGRVYRAEHVDLGLVRAIKIATDPEFVRQLRREGVVLARLRHPRIVEVYGADFTHDPPYIEMEYVEGGDLRQSLERGPLPVERAVQIMLDVLEALEHAHGKGVIHRDIKPANILLDKQGRAKVSDFGLGRVVEEVSVSAAAEGSADSESGAAQQSGGIAGTLRYMSPEQLDPRLLGGGQLDHRSDLYSLGLMLYEMLTGALPVGTRPPMPSERAPGVCAAFDEVFARCTAGEREERFAHAAEATEAVRGAWEQAEAARKQREEEERRRAEEEARARQRVTERTAEAEQRHQAGQYTEAVGLWGEVIAAGGDEPVARARIAEAEAALRAEAEQARVVELSLRAAGGGADLWPPGYWPLPASHRRRAPPAESPQTQARASISAARAARWRLPAFDFWLTALLGLVVAAVFVAGGLYGNNWTGWFDLLPFVIYGLIAAYAIFEGLRLRSLPMAVGLAAFMGLLPAVSYGLVARLPAGEERLLTVVIPLASGASAGAAWLLGRAFARYHGLRVGVGCTIGIVLFIVVGGGIVLLTEYLQIPTWVGFALTLGVAWVFRALFGGRGEQGHE